MYGVAGQRNIGVQRETIRHGRQSNEKASVNGWSSYNAFGRGAGSITSISVEILALSVRDKTNSVL